jgi:alpha-beta hydrolase superfamily lysophospholipase
MATSPQDTVVLIHGLWMTPRSWEHWKERYESRGHEVIVPAWPGLEVEVEALRADPRPLAGLGFQRVTDHLEGIIRGLDRPPIIMGHSMGGAVTQLLIDRGCGAAAVGIAPATVKGVYDLPLSTIRASAAVLGNPFNRMKATPITKKQFHYNFANTLTRAESDVLWERYAVPAANMMLFDLALGNFNKNAPTKVDFEKPDRAPYLAVTFGEDHVVPPKAARHNSEKYKTGTVAYTSFPGRPHFPGAPGWEEVADYALEWATEQAAKRRAGASDASADAGAESESLHAT